MSARRVGLAVVAWLVGLAAGWALSATSREVAAEVHAVHLQPPGVPSPRPERAPLRDAPPDVDETQRAVREERARWLTLLGRPPTPPAKSPDEQAIRGWFDALGDDGEVLLAVDCAFYPCVAAVARAGDDLGARLERAGAPYAQVTMHSLHGRDGERPVAMQNAIVAFPASGLTDPLERRFVERLRGALSERTRVEQARAFRDLAGDGALVESP